MVPSISYLGRFKFKNSDTSFIQTCSLFICLKDFYIIYIDWVFQVSGQLISKFLHFNLMNDGNCFLKSKRIQPRHYARVLFHSSGTLAQTRPLFQLTTKAQVFVLIPSPSFWFTICCNLTRIYILSYFSLKVNEFSCVSVHKCFSTVVVL